MCAALPWIAIGLLLAVCCCVSNAHGKKKESNKADRGSEDMALGMCFGVAISTALHVNIAIGMMVGMVLGLLVGSEIEKKPTGREEKAEARQEGRVS